MIESRALERTWQREPQIIYVHLSGPFPTRIWLPPFSEPVGSDAPSDVARVNAIGMAIAGARGRSQVGADTSRRRSMRGIPATSTTRRTSRTSPRSGPRPRCSSATPTCSLGDFAEHARARPQSCIPPWPLRCGACAMPWSMETASSPCSSAAMQESLLLNRYRAGRDQDCTRHESAVLVHRCRSSASRRCRTVAAARVRRRACRNHRRSDDRRRHLPRRHLDRFDRSGIRGDGA